MTRSHSKGSIMIFLIVTITIISALGAAVLSFTTTSLYSQSNVNNFNKASYLAESGIRYAEINAFNKKKYTIIDQSGTFQISEAIPQPVINTEGFRISLTGCSIKSEGIVKENSPFEAVKTIISGDIHGMPCWDFNTLPPLDNPDLLIDSCGKNNGLFNGIGFEQTCDGRIGRTLKLSGSDYVETSFRPFCEIGDQASFTIEFWAKPDLGTQGTVFGVRDNIDGINDNGDDLRFTVGIDMGRWFIAYGDEVISLEPVVFDKWQHLIITFNDSIIPKKITLHIQYCSGTGPSTLTEYNYNGSGIMPQNPNNIFIGAENVNDSPDSFFTGEIDEIKIYDSVQDINALKPFCTGLGAVAFYPFNGNTNDENNGFDGFAQGATGLTEDRFGCEEKAYYFKGGDADYIRVEQQIVSSYPFTFSAWIKPDINASGWRGIFAFLQNNKANVLFGTQVIFNPEKVNDPAGKHIRIFTVNDNEDIGTYWGIHSLKTDVLDDTWHLITVVFEKEKERRLYIDGNLLITGTSNVPYNPDVNMFIIGSLGEANPAFNGSFKGSIDEVSIYDRVLSQDEISRMAKERPAW